MESQIDTLAALPEQAFDRVTDSALWLQIGQAALSVIFIIALALFVVSVVRRVTRRWKDSVVDLPAIDPRRQRALTVSNLLVSATKYVVWTFAAIMILAEIGLDIGPLLAGAGIAGLAIGFGAQTLVKDVISGIFLLFDDILHVGDLITFGGTTGTVEGISLRLVKVRKFDGELVMIPAGELRTFGNKSVGFARVIVPVGVSYEQDLDAILQALDEIAQEWAAIPENKEVMLEEKPIVQAVTDLGESAVSARIIVQVIPGDQFVAERELRRMIKTRFDERGIEIPFPRRTIYVRNEAEQPSREIKPIGERRESGDAGEQN